MDARDLPDDALLTDDNLSPEDEAAPWVDPEFEAFVEETLDTAQHDYFLAYRNKTPEAVVLGETPAFPPQEVRSFGSAVDDEWRNLLVSGDNLPALRYLLDEKKAGRLKNADGSDGVRLVYIDPPFSTGDNFEAKNKAIAYADKKRGSEFIESLRKRLILLREVMADNASIFVHLDWRKSHYIKIVMDEVFGEHNFLNEIIWHYKAGSVGKSTFGRKHDTILRYARDRNAVVFNANAVRIPYAAATLQRLQYAGARERDLQKVLDRGGKVPTDVWDIGIVQGNSIESQGYPTQKPERLVARIVKAASNPGDIVLDCFAGSGTTLAVAEKMDRRWIGMDIGLPSIYTVQKRLLTIAASTHPDDLDGDASKKRAYGQPPRPFAVLSSGHYNFTMLRALPFADYRRFVLRLFDAQEVDETINGLRIDGRDSKGDPVIVDNFHVDPEAKVSPDSLADLAAVLGGRVHDRVLLIAPASRLAFYEDRLEFGGITFDIRRVPYTAVEAVSRLDRQPISKEGLNRIIETEVFDFAVPPVVEHTLDVAVRTLTINRFYSRVVASNLSDEARGFPALAVVMIDYAHDGEVFDIDATIFAEDLKKDGFVVSLAGAKRGEAVAVIFGDGNGNEHAEVFRELPWGNDPS